MNKELYERHFEIRRQIAKLEEQEEEIKKAITEDLTNLEARKYSSHFGTWSLCPKVSWTYSEHAEEKLAELKEKITHTKQDDETSGKATKTETSFLRFQAIKIHPSNL